MLISKKAGKKNWCTYEDHGENHFDVVGSAVEGLGVELSGVSGREGRQVSDGVDGGWLDGDLKRVISLFEAMSALTKDWNPLNLSRTAELAVYSAACWLGVPAPWSHP